MSAWETGTQLGPYKLLGPIGAGGMGEVWKARDTRLGRTVAIKRLKGEHSARFKQEARAIAALNHPNICQLYDVGDDYLVMEYIDGKKAAGPMDPAEAVQLALQITQALEAAHAKKIIHRDLKPDNIMQTASGVKLLDFGLAKLTADAATEPGQTAATLTVEGTVAGTWAYMSPEQARGEQVDERSDVFSLGAVLYEFLSGQRAFRGNSPAEILTAVLRDEPSPPSGPAELVSVIQRCLRKKRDDRFATMADVHTALEAANQASGALQQTSIAVLPFANMSADPENEYFSDGLAEEIINALTQVPDLLVTARTSAFSFKGKDTKVATIARELGVDHILEGSVRKAGNRVRVTAQLIKASTGFHLWSERYDRQLDDIFAVQDEISAAITDALKLKLTPGRQRHKPLLPAYEAYLRYRHYIWAFTPDSLRLSRENLEQAIALDPKFALPYVGLADHLLGLSFSGMTPAEETAPRMRELAQKALELDPELSDAHAMLGMVAADYDLDWEEAGRCFQRAMSCDPVSSFVHCWYAVFYLLSMGHLAEARTQMELFLREDPLSQVGRSCYALVLLALGLEEEAQSEFERSVDLDPTFAVCWTLLGIFHASRGEFDKALPCAETALSLTPDMPWVPGLSAGVYRMMGQTAKADDLLATLSPSGAYGTPSGLYVHALVCGDIDSAVEWAGKIIDQRMPGFIWEIVRPWESILQRSAGWPALLKKMHLEGAQR